MSSENEQTAAQDRVQLIAEIEQAFAALPLPDRITDCDPDCPECNAITAAFYGRQWRELDDAKLEANKSMSFFTPKAFHYFLPAYLRYSLRHFNLDSEVCEFTVYAVTLGQKIYKDPSRIAWLRERILCFDRTQADILLRFLTLVSEDEVLSDFHYDIEQDISEVKSLLRELKLAD